MRVDFAQRGLMIAASGRTPEATQGVAAVVHLPALSAVGVDVDAHALGRRWPRRHDLARAAAAGRAADNYADHSRSVDIMDRPRQVSRVIDHMLAAWEGHAAIDPRRVGMFGHSAGGFTTLATIGGVPDHTKIGPMCREYPGDFACQLVASSASPVAVPATLAVADVRIKSAVIAVPALGFTFSPDGLKNVRVPVRLWRAENDAVVPHPRYAEAVRLALPEAPDYHVVANAGHYDFPAPCSMALASIALAICSSSAGFDRTAFHVGFDADVVKFFEKTL